MDNDILQKCIAVWNKSIESRHSNHHEYNFFFVKFQAKRKEEETYDSLLFDGVESR